VTFPEGFTVAKMADRIDTSIERLTAQEFLAAAADPALRSSLQPAGTTSLEGMLFPDTYNVSNAESEAQVIERMIGLMERVGEQEDIVNRSAAQGVTPYEALIIASMIERKARVPEDRAKIARVIYNRRFLSAVSDPFPLQIDAAVLYGAAQAGLDPALPFAELRQVDTPWNTYLRAGLPATPIANPGRASIHAALNPAPNPSAGDPVCIDPSIPDPTKCSYLYYVIANEDGGHAFAATPEQHQANVDAAAAAGLL